MLIRVLDPKQYKNFLVEKLGLTYFGYHKRADYTNSEYEKLFPWEYIHIKQATSSIVGFASASELITPKTSNPGHEQRLRPQRVLYIYRRPRYLLPEFTSAAWRYYDLPIFF